MDAQQLDFVDRSFDSVAFNLVLCTIPDPIRALTEARRVARPGAPMTFLEHVRSNRLWVRLVQDALNPLVVRSSHDRINQDTEKLIRSAGITVLTSEHWFLGAMTLIVGRAP
jgi:ubiquinone/menaquinone biosynthesis C-methylase UbiE